MDLIPFLRNTVTQKINQGIKRRRQTNRERGPSTEEMEPRLLLFAATGNEWPNSQVVTISFQPDGTNLGGVTNNLNAAFNGNMALAGKWQTQILQAAQAWASATNINLVVMSDSGAASGSGSYQQGDPTMGDIRIGGYNFHNSSLARAMAPPPANNFSIAGDIVFNTGVSFGIGSGNDLFTVAAHEFGHAFGLDHTSSSNKSQMWPSYNGVKSTLAADDIAGIRSIYSDNAARSPDRYATGATPNSSFAAAADLSSSINVSTKTAVITGLDLTTASETEYFKFTAPAGSSSSATVGVKSSGLSLLSPLLTVYAADQKTVLGTASGLNQYGTTLSVKLTGVTVGKTYYVKVQGADSSVFSIGAHAMTLNLGTGATPAVPLPNTAVQNGSPLSSGGGIADSSGSHDDLLQLLAVPSISSISPDSGASSSDRTTNSNVITLNGSASFLDTVVIYQVNGTSRTRLGSTTANLENKWSFKVPGTLQDSTYTYVADGITLLILSSGTSDKFTVTIDTQAPVVPTLTGFSPDSGIVGDGITNCSAPILSGTAAPSSQIQIFIDGQAIPNASFTASAKGTWTYAVPYNLTDGSHLITANATDLAGNSSPISSPLNIKIDTQAPTSPSVRFVTQDKSSNGTPSLIVQGSAEANASVAVYLNGVAKGTTTADAAGYWKYTYTQSTPFGGTYVFTASAVDLSGNRSGVSAACTIVIGNEAPAISNLALSASSILSTNNSGVATTTATPTFTGTGTAGNSIAIYVDNVYRGSVLVGADGSWSFASPTLKAGKHTVFGVASDSLGRSSLASASLAFQV